MSLTKLFSKNYAVQNMKKSKGILAIMLIAIPLITLFFLYNYDHSGSSPYNMGVLVGANYIGMFIIPFILSIVLLGYVYQKNSIDFINSMPISRKKIYLTNIVIGVLYLIVLQLANFLVATSYVSVVHSTSFCVAMIWDGFFIMTSGYIFIFIISALALTISGNKFIQIVIVSLILFLIPFIKLVNFSEINSRDMNLINSDGTSSVYLYKKEALHTVPIGTFVKLVNSENIYELNSIILTLGLSIVYALIGMKLFEKRKMENTGSSFKSEKIHLFVKAMTIYPFVVFLCEIYDSIRFPELVLLVFFMFVYYFVYDLVTNKKIKLKVTIIAFIISCVLSVAVNFTFNFIDEHLPKNKDVYTSDIKEAELELSEEFYDYSNSNMDLSFGKLENKEILNYILENLTSALYTNEIEDVTLIEEYKRISLKIKLNNGRKVEFMGRLPKDVYMELLKRIVDDNNYIKVLSENYKIKRDSFLAYDSENFKARTEINKDDKLAEVINKNIENYIKSAIEENILRNENNLKNDDVSSNYTGEFKIYNYGNHNRNMYTIRNEFINQEMLQEIVKKINENTKKNIEEIVSKKEIYVNPYFNLNKYENGKLVEGSDGDLDAVSEQKILNLIKNDKNDFNPNETYYEIRDYTRGIRYYTNNITVIKEVIEFEKMKVEFFDDFEYSKEHEEFVNMTKYTEEDIQSHEEVKVF